MITPPGPLGVQVVRSTPRSRASLRIAAWPVRRGRQLPPWSCRAVGRRAADVARQSAASFMTWSCWCGAPALNRVLGRLPSRRARRWPRKPSAGPGGPEGVRPCSGRPGSRPPRHHWRGVGEVDLSRRRSCGFRAAASTPSLMRMIGYRPRRSRPRAPAAPRRCRRTAKAARPGTGGLDLHHDVVDLHRVADLHLPGHDLGLDQALADIRKQVSLMRHPQKPCCGRRRPAPGPDRGGSAPRSWPAGTRCRTRPP